MKSTLKIRTRFYTNPACRQAGEDAMPDGRQEFLIKDSIACPGFNRDGR